MADAISRTGRPDVLQIRGALGKEGKEFAVLWHDDPRDKEKLKLNRKRLGLPEENKGVLVIYAGGTIGSAPNDSEDPLSPQVVKPWPELADSVSALSSTSPQAISFRIDAVAFEVPLDSSNMGPTEWNAMAKLLQMRMEEYEGFVIAHGTDTMVYSASALSFMLENLQKPVILTGSQLSAIGNVRNDAQQNLITAILIANAKYSQIKNVPEVCIFFRDELLRGNRAIKVDAEGYVAYKTPNFPALGTAGAKIAIREDLILEADKNKAFSVNDKLNTNVINLGVFPGIQDQDMLRSILSMKGLKAVVLRTFGAGNTATAASFLSQLDVAKDTGIVVVNVTQCAQGSVQMGLYETSAMLMKYGVISGVDITAEAALTKLMVLLGDDRYADEVHRRAQENLRGEQSESIFVTPMKQPKGVSLSTANPLHWFLTEEDVQDHRDKVRHAVLILHSATVQPEEATRPENREPRLYVEIYINVSKDDALDRGHPKLACDVSRLKLEDGTLVFDVTDAVRRYIDPGRKNSFLVRLGGAGEGELSWASAELALYVKV